jgi:hypothetical protein
MMIVTAIMNLPVILIIAGMNRPIVRYFHRQFFGKLKKIQSDPADNL